MRWLRVERGADDRHAVFFEKFARFRHRWDAAESTEFCEKGLHLSGRLKGDQEAAAFWRDLGPDVRKTARGEQRVAWQKPIFLLAHLKRDFTADDVKPFVLIVVDVPRWPELGLRVVFNDEELATGVGGRDLAVNRAAITEVAGLMMAIITHGDFYWFG